MSQSKYWTQFKRGKWTHNSSNSKKKKNHHNEIQKFSIGLQ
jgi:hypothetical protein